MNAGFLFLRLISLSCYMLISFAKNISRLLGHLIFPPLCIGCLANHRAKANDFCLPCFVDLPYTDFHLLEDNQLKRRFYGKVELKYALALFHFVENSIIQQMIHRLKYKNRTDIGVKLGQIYAEKIKETDLHRQFDIIIPVPLV